MNIYKLDKTCFLNNKKELTPFIPEIEIKDEEFNERLWRYKFPIFNNVNIQNLKLTNIGIYSIATPNISLNLVDFIIELNNRYLMKPIEEITITETNGGVGGFSIRLAQTFYKLNIVEILKEHADLIKNNLIEYKIDNIKKDIKIINRDYLDIMFNLDNDIIISDPPWGGRDYSNKKSIRLGMNNLNIACIINELYKKNKFKIFILFVSVNFDIQNFLYLIEIKNIVIHKMRKHYFIALINI